MNLGEFCGGKDGREKICLVQRRILISLRPLIESLFVGPWYDMYLKDRRALMLNHNPFMAMKLDARPEYNAPVSMFEII